jgi:hypothetical protein
MARRKNQPESVRVKCDLSDRLRSIRVEMFGERGGSEMARRLGLPIRTWYNYEGGVTVPAEVLLRFVELTAVEPLWLLHGKGPKYRSAPPSLSGDESGDSVESLLRTALDRLGRRDEPAWPASRRFVEPPDRRPADDEVVLVGVEGTNRGAGAPAPGAGPRYLAASRDWLDADRDFRFVRVAGDAMAPIVADGACVAFAEEEETPAELDGRLVVAWVEGEPLVRWFALTGRFGLLRAENPGHEPATVVIDLDGPPRGRRLRRVLGISTPH